MSEDFLSRWSRRKRDAVQESEGVDNAKASNVEASADASTPRCETPDPPAAAPAEPLFDLKDLPSIESITAATDIRPFLAPGVPPELARAALRRAWTADPSIRDFVGLADYAWDYHKPGSMAGFGPLEMTDDLRQAVARIIGAIPDESGSSTSSGLTQSVENPNDIKPAALTSSAVSLANPQDDDAHPQASPANSEDMTRVRERDALPASIDAATHNDSAERVIATSNNRRGHGRALPKS